MNLEEKLKKEVTILIEKGLFEYNDNGYQPNSLMVSRDGSWESLSINESGGKSSGDIYGITSVSEENRPDGVLWFPMEFNI